MNATNGERPRCKGLKEDGEQCRSRILPEGSEFCLRHSDSPAHQALAAASALKGGLVTRSTRKGERGLVDEELPALDSPEAAAEWCEIVGRAVATGRIGHAQGASVIRTVNMYLRATDAREVHDRIERLSEQLQELKRQPVSAR